MFKTKYRHMSEQISPDPALVQEMISLSRERKEKKFSHYRKYVFAAASIFICIFFVIPALAANVPPIYDLMYYVSPQIAQFFIPVQKSCEDNGIKMEVVSSYIHENKAEIYITMQDLTGDRIDETIDLFDSYSIRRPFDSSGYCEKVGYDAQTKTATFLITVTEWQNQTITGDKITFSVSEFISRKKEYNNAVIPVDFSTIHTARQTKAVDPTGWGGNGTIPDFLEQKAIVLVPANPAVDFPIEGVELTGIGYIDGKLHIQTAVSDALKNDNHGFLFLENKEGVKIDPEYTVSFLNHYDKEGRIDYQESVFDIAPETLAGFTLYGNFVTSGMFTQGDWQITFPLV